MSKYSKLQSLAKQNQSMWELYEDDCRTFIRDLRIKLCEYLDCTPKCISWQRFPEFDKDTIPNNYHKSDFTNSMILYKDGFWEFQFQIKFDNSSIIIRFRVKKDKETFIVKVGNNTFEITDNSFDELLKHTYQLSAEYLQTEFANFLDQSKNTIGFTIN